MLITPFWGPQSRNISWTWINWDINWEWISWVTGEFECRLSISCSSDLVWGWSDFILTTLRLGNHTFVLSFRFFFLLFSSTNPLSTWITHEMAFDLKSFLFCLFFLIIILIFSLFSGVFLFEFFFLFYLLSIPRFLLHIKEKSLSKHICLLEEIDHLYIMDRDHKKR